MSWWNTRKSDRTKALRGQSELLFLKLGRSFKGAGSMLFPLSQLSKACTYWQLQRGGQRSIRSFLTKMQLDLTQTSAIFASPAATQTWQQMPHEWTEIPMGQWEPEACDTPHRGQTYSTSRLHPITCLGGGFEVTWRCSIFITCRWDSRGFGTGH